MSIVCELRPDGTWLVLPIRRVPPLVGWGIALFGAGILAFMVFWIGGAAGWGRGPGSGLDAVRYVFAAFGLPGLLAGLAAIVIGAGLALGLSRCELGITRERLLVRERIGRLRWTRAMPLGALRGIIVPERATPLGGLCLRRSGRPDVRCAPGYDAATIAELAARLPEELARTGGPRLQVVEREGLGPPPGTLRVEEADGRLAIRQGPPAKPWSLLVFATCWCGGLAFITWNVARGSNPDGSVWGPLLFLSAFWLVGIGVVLAFVHAGWRRLDVLWADDRLTVIDASPLRRRLHSWSRDELADILVEEHGSGSGRYEAVTIRPRTGRPQELPHFGDVPAAAWIAGRLRQALANP